MATRDENKIKLNLLKEKLKQQAIKEKEFIDGIKTEINNLRTELSAKTEQLATERALRVNLSGELERLRTTSQQEIRRLTELLEETRQKAQSDIAELKQGLTEKAQQLTANLEKEKTELLEQLKLKDDKIHNTEHNYQIEVNTYKQKIEQENAQIRAELKKLQDEKANLEQALKNQEEQFFEERVLLKQEINELKKQIGKI